jgi:hypothetical protein
MAIDRAPAMTAHAAGGEQIRINKSNWNLSLDDGLG